VRNNSSLGILAIPLMLSFAPRAAPAGTLGIYADTLAVSNYLTSMLFVDLHVVYTGDPSIQALQFTVATPTCNTIFGRFDIPVSTMIGASESGVMINLGACATSPVHVLTIRVLPYEIFEYCCAWLPVDIAVVDCDGNDVPFTAPAPGWLTEEPCEFVAPHSPWPADGAVNVPLTVDLDWESRGAPACDLGDALIHRLYFGTDPEALTTYWDVGPPFTVSGLLHGTRYYWQAVGTTYNGAGPYPGPLWTFTTKWPVAAERTTWGRIKALYR